MTVNYKVKIIKYCCSRFVTLSTSFTGGSGIKYPALIWNMSKFHRKSSPQQTLLKKQLLDQLIKEDETTKHCKYH